MKIMLAGSFSFAKEMLIIKQNLEDGGHTVLTTSDMDMYVKKPQLKSCFKDELENSVEFDSLREGFDKVIESDAVLVCNYLKNEIKGYLGTSVLMEIALAYYNNKEIFLLNDFDRSQNYGLEISVINPVIIGNDLSGI